jgi:hypothetical protein
MFQVDRAQRLQQVEWNADDGRGIFYLEAWQYSNIQTCTAQNYRHGILHDSEIDLWLKQEVSRRPMPALWCFTNTCRELRKSIDKTADMHRGVSSHLHHHALD